VFLATNCQIVDISALGGLSFLTVLEIEDNQISDIGPISGLKQLESLFMSNNNIADVSALSELTELEYLWLSENQISNIDSLKNLLKLDDAELENNHITDLSPLVANSGIGSSTHIYVENNPIDCEEQADNIQKLREMGVFLYTDCPWSKVLQSQIW
jgi:internalin A